MALTSITKVSLNFWKMLFKKNWAEKLGTHEMFMFSNICGKLLFFKKNMVLKMKISLFPIFRSNFQKQQKIQMFNFPGGPSLGQWQKSQPQRLACRVARACVTGDPASCSVLVHTSWGGVCAFPLLHIGVCKMLPLAYVTFGLCRKKRVFFLFVFFVFFGKNQQKKQKTTEKQQQKHKNK